MNVPRYSYVDENGSRLVVIELKQPKSNDLTRVVAECVVDVDDFDEAAGVEILDLSTPLGHPAAASIDAADANRVRVAYHETTDALSVHLGRARAQHQILADAELFLDSTLAVVRIEVRFPRWSNRSVADR